jgi:hypothetical protein
MAEENAQPGRPDRRCVMLQRLRRAHLPVRTPGRSLARISSFEPRLRVSWMFVRINIRRKLNAIRLMQFLVIRD